ncbi:hypothetical protein [Planomonospora algeriensis]
MKDLFADPARYESELKALGLGIRLSLEPTSRGMAGTVLVAGAVDLQKKGRPVPAGGGIQTIKATASCTEPSRCPIGLRIPVGYRHEAEVILGRQARPGERYWAWLPADMRGEPLHCVPYVNKTVAEVLPLLRERGLRAEFVSAPGWKPRPSAPGDWYVHSSQMNTLDKVQFAVGPDPGRTWPPDPSCAGGPSGLSRRPPSPGSG